MTYKESNDNSKERDCSRMKGFMSIMKCDYCKKQGHSSEECWTKHPVKRKKLGNLGEEPGRLSYPGYRDQENGPTPVPYGYVVREIRHMLCRYPCEDVREFVGILGFQRSNSQRLESRS